jgi:hypothetical protein
MPFEDAPSFALWRFAAVNSGKCDLQNWLLRYARSIFKQWQLALERTWGLQRWAGKRSSGHFGRNSRQGSAS